MSEITRRLLGCAVVAAGMLIPGGLLCAQEWEDNTAYYEDDAWYDVTEWFDGNDYNPTDERPGRWDDEQFNFEKDLDDIQDDLSLQELEDRGEIYDTGASDRYESYGEESDGADYDYEGGGYAYYRDYDDNGVYDFSFRYHDYDQDGNYDAYSTYHDWDGDGYFEDFEFYTFDDVPRNARQQASQRTTRQSSRQRVSGQVQQIRQVSLRSGTKHLLATLPHGNQTVTVDLGPVGQLETQIEQGERIAVSGPITEARGRPVLLAQSLEANGQTHQIERRTQQFRGNVAGIRTANVQGGRHQMVIVADSESGQKRLVDLGSADNQPIPLQVGQQVMIEGVPVKVRGRMLVMAHQVKAGDQTVSIDRDRQPPVRRQQVRQARQQNSESRRRSTQQDL